MLKKICRNSNIDPDAGALKIARAQYPQPFISELEFNAPARGMWNIVHTGMLIPQAHQIFVCAQGCLRGVILTAAEMNAMERMSFVTVQENELFDGTMESSIVEGVSAVLDKMEVYPPAVLVFLSCIQLFAGCDQHSIYGELRRRYPDIDFIECLMHPTMRKSALTPDQFMRRQLYAPLHSNGSGLEKHIAIIGNDRPTAESSELVWYLKKHGFILHDITLCKTYEEYKQIADCRYFISYLTTAQNAGAFLSSRLQREHRHLPLSYNFAEIEDNYRKLSAMLQIEMIDFQSCKAAALSALQRAATVMGNRPIAIDYTATLRNLSLARLLLDNGFKVERVYTDVFIAEEKSDFEYLQKHYPDLLIYPTLHPRMRFAVAQAGSGDEFIAIGQKAACYTGTRHLVNIVSGGGWYGFDGIRMMAEAMIEAAGTVSDVERVIQLKGWGCDSCL